MNSLKFHKTWMEKLKMPFRWSSLPLTPTEKVLPQIVKFDHHPWFMGTGAGDDVWKSHSSFKVLASLCIFTPQSPGKQNGPGTTSALRGAFAQWEDLGQVDEPSSALGLLSRPECILDTSFLATRVVMIPLKDVRLGGEHRRKD